jgi:Tfp pilus assembly PilM family ATPase
VLLRRFNFFSKTSLLGLDIQSRAIRLTRLNKKCMDKIEQLVERALPENVFTEGKVIQWDILRTHLSQLVIEQHLHGLEVAICLPANLVRMQRISLPSGLSETEIATEIRIHLQRDLPGMTDALCIDFSVLDRNKNVSEIFFVAMREEYLLQYTECVEAAGLRVNVIDVDVCAITRAANRVLPVLIPNKAYALLYVTDNDAFLVGFERETIAFHQYWELIKLENFSIQLNDYLQLNFSPNKQVEATDLFLYGIDKNAIALNNRSVMIHEIDPFSKIKFLGDKPKGSLSNYLLAYGLAMRQRTLW